MPTNGQGAAGAHAAGLYARGRYVRRHLSLALARFVTDGPRCLEARSLVPGAVFSWGKDRPARERTTHPPEGPKEIRCCKAQCSGSPGSGASMILLGRTSTGFATPSGYTMQ